jgi:hypothetical protein
MQDFISPFLKTPPLVPRGDRAYAAKFSDAQRGHEKSVLFQLPLLLLRHRPVAFPNCATPGAGFLATVFDKFFKALKIVLDAS